MKNIKMILRRALAIVALPILSILSVLFSANAHAGIGKTERNVTPTPPETEQNEATYQEIKVARHRYGHSGGAAMGVRG